MKPFFDQMEDYLVKQKGTDTHAQQLEHLCTRLDPEYTAELVNAKKLTMTDVFRFAHELLKQQD